MQRVTCTVMLSGDPNNTVIKHGVSPAEIMILNAIHGGEGENATAAVKDIKPTRMDKTVHAQERSRLRTIYGHHVVDRLFPGEFNQLPATLKDIAPPEEKPVDAIPDNGEGDKGGDADDEDAEDGEKDGAMSEDDQLLLERVMTAQTKSELQDIARECEVDLSNIADRMDAMQATIIKEMGLKAP